MSNRDYLPELERARASREKSLQDAKADSMRRLMKDLEIDRVKNPQGALADRWNPDAEEDEDDDTEINIVDRSEEPWPGQYIDITRARRHEDEGINWPRPG
ncbi:hypothetical protein C0995_003903 [Termitomyces sp. Mi166|nr:hypothetical protein C0995_003903 [Termitomyces sp. Mi166\